MTKTMKFAGLLAAVVILAVVGCKKDKPKTAPTLTTTAATDITTVSAKTGGTITGTGGADITETGVVYSKTNNMPTLTDSKVTSTTLAGTFTVDLANLDPGSNYYIRAYATNSIGTGYGDVKTFMTGNAAPEARNVKINEAAAIEGQPLTMSYTYFDFENDPESGTSIQWYIANDSIGAAVTPISGATTASYTPVTADISRFVYVGVTPKASSGTTTGTEAKSYWRAISAETVTFTYNGQSVTYGVITSPVTGRKWMDRNLGAQAAATSWDDYLGYGDLFQWGRPADGHQLINWTSRTTGTAVNGITATYSPTIVPGHSLFIKGNYNWQVWTPATNVNPNLWEAPDYVNNVCPSGWHVPSNTEWVAENITPAEIDNDNQNWLKLTVGAQRLSNSGNLLFIGTSGDYFTSTHITLTFSGVDYYYPTAYKFRTATMPDGVTIYVSTWESYQGDNLLGSMCRCIKNQ